MSTAIVLFAHGSPVESANGAVREVARAAAAEVAFLEPCRPSLEETVGRLAAAGVSRILVVPYFLTLGLHLQRDLPVLVQHVAELHPGVEIRVTPPLDGHPGLAAIVLDRVRAAFEAWR